jgi:branched-chain amino acid transport system ATP-binding protein
MVEQESKKNLEFADIGYALLSGQIVSVGMGGDLLQSSKMGKLFLGG